MSMVRTRIIVFTFLPNLLSVDQKSTTSCYIVCAVNHDYGSQRTTELPGSSSSSILDPCQAGKLMISAPPSCICEAKDAHQASFDFMVPWLAKIPDLLISCFAAQTVCLIVLPMHVQHAELLPVILTFTSMSHSMPCKAAKHLDEANAQVQMLKLPWKVAMIQCNKQGSICS